MRTNHRITFLAVAAVAATLSRLDAQDVWAPEGFDNISIYSLAVGPTGTRYAGSFDGIFESRDPGVWTLIPNSPRAATTIVPHPAHPDTLYAGSYLSLQWGIHQSTDGGEHFRKLTGFPAGVRAIAIDPLDSDTVYVGGDNPMVYTSRDAGATFSSQVDPGLVERITALVVDPTRRGLVYGGTDVGSGYYYYYYYFAPPAPVIRSNDSGTHWSAALQQTLRTTDPLLTTSMAVDPRSGTLYVGTWDDPDSSILRTSDTGLTWDRFRVGVVGRIQTLVIDTHRTNRIFAGTTGAGVLRSDDGGATWIAMNEGLPNLGFDTLVLDSGNGQLLASDGQSVFRMRLEPGPSTCTADRYRLCLLGGRYEVLASGISPKTGLGSQGRAIPGGDRFGSFSLPGITGDPELPEVFVKMVDATPGPPVLVFYGGLTSLPYTVVVTDTETGRLETYRNDSANPFCGGVDGTALVEDSDSSSVVLSGAERAKAAESGYALSLLSGRFSITLSAYSSRHGRSAPGVAMAKTDRYGYFSLPDFTGDVTFPEVHVKMLDFRPISGRFLLFHTGLTSLDYTLSVTDATSGEVHVFQSPGKYCGEVASLPGN